MIVLLNEGGIIDTNGGIIDTNGGIIENAAPPSSLFTYLRPDGTSSYFRPTSNDPFDPFYEPIPPTYKRP